MRKILISLLSLLVIFWLQEGFFVGLGLYLPLVASVVALIHLYRLPQRWLLTLFIGLVIELYSGGFSGAVVGFITIGLFCQTLFSVVSHASDRFYVVVIGGLAVLLGDVLSRLSVNLISNSLLGGSFEPHDLTISNALFTLVASFIILFIGKRFINNKRYV